MYISCDKNNSSKYTRKEVFSVVVRLADALQILLVESDDPHYEESDDYADLLTKYCSEGVFACCSLSVHQRNLQLFDVFT